MLPNVRKPQGLVVTIKTYRKNSHGTSSAGRPKGAGRKGKTGKKAIVRNDFGDIVGKFEKPTIEALRTLLRCRYNIDPNLTINRSGETKF